VWGVLECFLFVLLDNCWVGVMVGGGKGCCSWWDGRCVCKQGLCVREHAGNARQGRGEVDHGRALYNRRSRGWPSGSLQGPSLDMEVACMVITTLWTNRFWVFMTMS
jgi:hypothetical protein